MTSRAMTTGPSEVEYTAPGFAFALKVSQLRSFFRVGMALNEAFPTEEEFEQYMTDPETIETLNIVADLMDATVASKDQEPDALDKHHGLAVEALEPLAERLNIDGDDLLVILVA